MRDIFASEERCVRNLLVRGFDVATPQTSLRVAAEHYCEPRVRFKGPRFNIDFMLKFVPATEMPTSRDATGSPILPNTIGADLFLLVEKGTDRPLLLDLIAGEAFPMKYYKQHIESIEAAISVALRASGHNGAVSRTAAKLRERVGERRLLKAAQLRRSKYCRLLIIGGDACFLFFPNLAAPEMRGMRHTLLDSDAGRIDCYVDNSEVVCFDGWLPVKVVESEWKLEAIWKDDLKTESSTE